MKIDRSPLFMRISGSALLLLLVVIGGCQRTASMAIEVRTEDGTNPPWRVNLVESGETGIELSGEFLSTLPETVPPPAPVTVSLSFKAEGAHVIASAFKQDHRLLGRHSVHQYEFVELNELRTIGYRPLILRIVPAVPPAQHGLIVSKAPSLRVETTSTSQSACAAIITDLSSRDVVGYILGTGSDYYSFKGIPVIRGKGKVRKYCPSSGEVLTAATFRDRSHEGDDRAAAGLLGWQIAAITQYRLITPIIDRVVADPALNDDQRIALIKENIFHLAIEADVPTIRAMRSRFLKLPADVIAGDLNVGLLMAREQIWHWFYPYELARTASPQRTPPAVSKLWQEARDQP
jgi:hypothetical protein